MGDTGRNTAPSEWGTPPAAHCVCLGGRVVVCYDPCPRAAGLLRERGLDVRAVPGSELVKGRGGPRSMSRPIYLPAAGRE